MKPSVLLASFLLTGCAAAHANPSSGPNPLVGTWQLQQYVDVPDEGEPVGYAVSALLVGLVTLVGHGINVLGNITNVGLLFLIPVMAAATFYGLRTGLFAGLLSSLCYNFFFIPPFHTFTIQDPQNILTVLILLGVAVVTSQLAARVRAQADLAQHSASQNSALAGFARLLTGIADRAELGQTLCAEAARLLDIETVLLLSSPDGLEVIAAYPLVGRLGVLEQAAAKWCLDHNQPTGRGSDTLTASDWLFHPVAAGGRVLGVFGSAKESGDHPVRSDQLPLLLSLLDQAALALERIALEEEMASVSQLRERDRLRASLLSSVSHDLRTPLTTILASVAELKQATPLDGPLVEAIQLETERLNRFVSNLLEMARIEAGALRLALEPLGLAEAVTSAAHDLRHVLQGHPVQLAVPPDLPLLRLDAQLFHHCLINLLENAGKYAEPETPIQIVADRTRDSITLSVKDQGPGLPAGQEKRIFDTFTRLEGSDRKGGAGLGLAIVKGFAEAMGLSVFAANRRDVRGACFTLCFPETLIFRSNAAPE